MTPLLKIYSCPLHKKIYAKRFDDGDCQNRISIIKRILVFLRLVRVCCHCKDREVTPDQMEMIKNRVNPYFLPIEFSVNDEGEVWVKDGRKENWLWGNEYKTQIDLIENFLRPGHFRETYDTSEGEKPYRYKFDCPKM